MATYILGDDKKTLFKWPELVPVGYRDDNGKDIITVTVEKITGGCSGLKTPIMDFWGGKIRHEEQPICVTAEKEEG